MKQFTQTLYPLLLTLLLLSGCVPVTAPAAEALPSPTAALADASTSPLSANPQECVESYDPAVDYFPDKVEGNTPRSGASLTTTTTR
ncbi:MAG: hypothetical protein R3E79_15980 [Caldilineaceae bacterium]